MKRLWIDIQGDIFDIWHIKTAEREDDYNEVRGEMDYLLVLNSASEIGDIKRKVYKFINAAARDEVLAKLKEAILNSPGMYFVGETDGALEDDEMKPKKDRLEYEEEDDEYDEELDGPEVD